MFSLFKRKLKFTTKKVDGTVEFGEYNLVITYLDGSKSRHKFTQEYAVEHRFYCPFTGRISPRYMFPVGYAPFKERAVPLPEEVTPHHFMRGHETYLSTSLTDPSAPCVSLSAVKTVEVEFVRKHTAWVQLEEVVPIE